MPIELVMVVVVGLIELGKRKAPGTFTSDLNAFWSILLGAAVNAIAAFSLGGDARQAALAGAIAGASTAGVYRAVSGLSKKSSIDFTEQALPLTVSHDKGESDAEDDEPKIGFDTK